MTLRAKFAILLGLLAVTMSAILAVALTFGRFLESELVWPFEETTTVLRGLEELKGSVRRQGEKIANHPGEPESVGGTAEEQGITAEDRRRIAAAAAEDVVLKLAAVRDNPGLQPRVGISAALALSMQVERANKLAGQWLESQTPELSAQIFDAHEQIFQLIEAMNRRLINEAPSALAYGEELRRIHQTLILSGVASVGLFAVLCIILFNRWVVAPVRELRRAAVMLSKGQFEHRVPVTGSDELAQLSAEVNQMAGMISTMQSEAIERERLAATGEMVRRLAHNIRNPLAGIRSLAELSRRRATDHEAVRKDQSEIISTVDRFNGWLTDLLGVTTPVGIVPRETPVEKWLSGVLESQRALARMRSVEIVSDSDGAPAVARFDPSHLEHAVVALVTNAIQASPSGGRVSVRATALDGQRWQIVVMDEGPGVPPEIRERIFRTYFTTKRDGTGIGLAIAKQVVKEHGGDLVLESNSGRGAAFCVRLPIASAQPVVEAEKNRSVGMSQGRD